MSLFLSRLLLECSKGSFEDLPDILRRLGKKQIKDHGESIPDLADNIFGFREKKAADMMAVHEAARYQQHKPDPVPAPPPRPACHLVKLRTGERFKLMPVEQIGMEHYDGPGWKVDTGCHGRGGEYRAKMSPLHHFLNKKFPGGQLSAMMRGHLRTAENVEMLVVLQVRKAFKKVTEIPCEVLIVCRAGCGPEIFKRRITVCTRLQKKIAGKRR